MNYSQGDGASNLVHASDLVCANDVSISGHVIEDIWIQFERDFLKFDWRGEGVHAKAPD